MWGKINIIDREHTGEYFQTEQGELGEAVYQHGWGGVDLLFETGDVATCALGDLVRVGMPTNAARFERFEFNEAGQVKTE